MIDAVVVGGGITGLCAALRLRENGLRVRLLERSAAPGGMVRSTRLQGNLLEAGPNSFLAKPGILSLLEKLNLEEEIIRPCKEARHRYLAYRGAKDAAGARLVRAPLGIVPLLRTPILPARAKLRLCCEPFLKSTDVDDESVRSFVARRFGPAAADSVAAPLLNGIWAADTGVLSARSALSHLWELEQDHGSVLRGALRRARRGGGSRAKAPQLMTLRDGLARLPQRLAERLGDEALRFGCEAVSITETAERVRITTRDLRSGATEEISARTVLLALPADAQSRLVDDLEPALALGLRQIPYAPIGVLHLLYRKADVQHPLDGFGFLVPPSLGWATLGAIFSSSLFSQRAAEDAHLLTCFCGGALQPQKAAVSDPAVQQQVLSEVASLIGASRPATVLAAVPVPRAIPNYAIGHFRLQHAVDEFEAVHPRIRLLGNWRKGISIPDRVDEGLKVGQVVSEKLRAERMVERKLRVG